MEKRKYKRFEKELSIIFRYDDVNHFVTAVAQNISLGGMCLKLDINQNLSLGKIMNLQFELKGHSEIVELKALIKWLSDPGKDSKVEIGIEFTQLDNPEMSSLKDKLHKLLLEKSKP